jgi:alkanesulfonate monooxygenase SsuD/methylene tetrahydromethanopterin reductase-like flavin-dependent oxidoreductase (luciferase family)
MRHGLYLPTHGEFADVGLLAALGAEAEAADWHGVFLWDELLPIFPSWPDTIDTHTALTAIAGATDRIRFGALVTPLARRRPETFAHQTATLDRYSGGRLVVGVGLGNPPSQFGAFGLPTDNRERASMLDEFLDLLVLFWSGEPVQFEGSHYRADGVTLPAPAQRPRIPVWVGADSHSKAPLRRAARWDGFAPASTGWPDAVLSVQEYVDAMDLIRSERAARGEEGSFDVVVIGSRDGTTPSRDEAGAYEAAGVTWWLHQRFSVDEVREAIVGGPPA